MTPLLADGIDLPIVLVWGVSILVPLIAFEVFAEAFVLRVVWRQRFTDLCSLTFLANLWSLLAGIPTKMLNAWLYDVLLPGDLPGFFARYPLAVCIGTLVYFAVTVGIEGAYAFLWLRKRGWAVKGQTVWKGMLLANLASYAVVAPVHYFATRPTLQVRDFTRHTPWARSPTTRVVFVDQAKLLKCGCLDGSKMETIVPASVHDYLVSTNLNVCLFRGDDGNLHLYRRDVGQSNLVALTHERFCMDQAAFSPSGQRAAFAEKEGNSLDVVGITTGKRVHEVLAPRLSRSDGPCLAWSQDESKFYLTCFESNSLVGVTIAADMTLKMEALEDTNGAALLPCFGRVGSRSSWYGGTDWGRGYNQDSCGDLNVRTEPGLASGLRVFRGDQRWKPVLDLHVSFGLLHLPRFWFGDAAFLSNGQECLFEANGYIYLLDLQHKRVGTVARGDRFILLTDRYRKHLD